MRFTWLPGDGRPDSMMLNNSVIHWIEQNAWPARDGVEMPRMNPSVAQCLCCHNAISSLCPMARQNIIRMKITQAYRL